jgi:hypothetical protein
MHMRRQPRPPFSSLAARLGVLTLGYTAEALEKHAAVSGADIGTFVSDLARALRGPRVPVAAANGATT